MDTDASGIEFFFNPASIAIVGASSDFHKPSGRPLAALLKRGYRGKLFPVNPRYKEINGIECYPSILDVPEEVDLVIIGIPADMVLDVLVQCAEKKVKAVIIFSSGFAEVGPEGKALQQKITDLARRHKIRICGPNCFGLINLNTSVMASFANIVELEPVSPKTLGFVTQSGAFGAMIYTQALQRGVGFSSFISVGNEADLEFSDFVSYLLDDAETRVIGGYLEGAKDGKKLRKVAEKALRLQKPMLIMKVGRSNAGSRAASSHTGSMAGNDRVYDAFFKQMGIIRIEDLNELTSFVTLFRSGRKPEGRNVAILSGSGGAGVMLADKCENSGLIVPELTGETRYKLEQYLPFFASAKNPVDLTAQVGTDPSLLGKCLRAVLEDENIHSVIINMGFSDHTGPTMAKDIIEIYESTGKPVVLVSSVFPGSKEAPRILELIKNAGVPLITDGLQAVQALVNLVWYREKINRAAGAIRESENAFPADKVKRMLNGTDQLTEYQAKQVMASYGIPVTREGLASSANEAVEIARQIGYPVVLKVQSPQIMHKTESGGIRLNLSSDEEVHLAYNEIMASIRNYRPDARIEGILVQEMLRGGVEVIIGTTKDPVFGHVVMFGLGGIFVEALQDVSFRITPLTRSDAEEMVREIKGFRVLQGMRGRPPVNFNALTDVILRISKLVTDYGSEIKELDVNPLIISAEGAKVADALIVKNGY